MAIKALSLSFGSSSTAHFLLSLTSTATLKPKTSVTAKAIELDLQSDTALYFVGS
jgi:hypothetical protein